MTSAMVVSMSTGDGSELGLGSRSDLEALHRSGRGKLVVLAMLIALALAAAAWSFLRKRGHGNPEDPTKVLVVAQGTTIGFSSVLRDAGFDAAEGTLSAWENKATDEVEGLELEGVAAVLRLADEFGYGYVVFEGPQELSWEGIDVKGGAPEFAEHVRFAVVSVGDFAFPHVMTVNPPPSTVVRDPGIVLLQALFEQERLARLLPSNDNPSIDDIQLRDRLQEGLARLDRLPEAEKMAQKIVDQVREQLVDDERAEPKPRLLAEPLESGNPFPLANGQILTVGRGFQIVTRDAVRISLDFEDYEHFSFGAAQDEPLARKPCDSLMGGMISRHDSARYGASADGDALLVKSLSEGLVLWTLDRRQPGCVFSRAGEVPSPTPGVADGGIPHGSGRVARAGQQNDLGLVEVVKAGTDERQILGMLEGVQLGDPTWLDEHTLAVVGHSRVGNADGLYLLSTEVPMTVLRIDASVLEGAGSIEQVAAVPDGRHLVVTAEHYPRKLYRLELPLVASALFASYAELPGPPENEVVEREGLPALVMLDPGLFGATLLTVQERVDDPVVSSDGRWVAVTVNDPTLDSPDAPHDTEIALVGLDGTSGAKMRLVTRNALRDHSPRFSADGRFIIFQTRVEIPRTSWIITAPRIAPVP